MPVNNNFSATLSTEADQVFTLLPPVLGKVFGVSATTATGASPTDLSAATALGAQVGGTLVEFWADADVYVALSGVSTGTLAATGTVAGGNSGALVKAYERLPFFIRDKETWLYLVSSSGTANVKIRPAGALNLAESTTRV